MFTWSNGNGGFRWNGVWEEVVSEPHTIIQVPDLNHESPISVASLGSRLQCKANPSQGEERNQDPETTTGEANPLQCTIRHDLGLNCYGPGQPETSKGLGLGLIFPTHSSGCQAQPWPVEGLGTPKGLEGLGTPSTSPGMAYPLLKFELVI